jgi:aerobic-type carbon monoxide dehydrogenase small subunit (CoxS/CutS family)
MAAAKVTQLTINGTARAVEADPERSLLSVLRYDLDLTGSKYGCGEGQCGACTVLVDGAAVPSCVTTIGSVAGKQITTIEGLEKNGQLHPVQEAFLQTGAMQCGFCTPGMIMAGVALVNENPDRTDAQIAEAMDGNICRCGTYPRIIKAIQLAATTMAKEEGEARS